MQKKILISESSASVSKFISLALKLQGYNVVSVSDNREAIEKLMTDKFDLLITDLYMPNLDCVRLIKSIRQNEGYKYLPIIVLTSIEQDEDINQALLAGANSFLLKPFNTKRIQYEVARYLAD